MISLVASISSAVITETELAILTAIGDEGKGSVPPGSDAKKDSADAGEDVGGEFTPEEEAVISAPLSVDETLGRESDGQEPKGRESVKSKDEDDAHALSAEEEAMLAQLGGSAPPASAEAPTEPVSVGEQDGKLTPEEEAILGYGEAGV